MLLSDLPHFVIDTVRDADTTPRLVGHFTALASVREGRSWLYDPEEPLIGDLEELVPTERRAVFATPDWTSRSRAQPGAALPWIDGYWQAYHVAMILQAPSTWQRTEFVPSDAQYFELAGQRGWQPVGADLPNGAVAREVVQGGWDHEHCELCQSKIGIGGAAVGYRDHLERWLCESCYNRYAKPRDLSFLIES